MKKFKIHFNFKTIKIYFLKDFIFWSKIKINLKKNFLTKLSIFKKIFFIFFDQKIKF